MNDREVPSAKPVKSRRRRRSGVAGLLVLVAAYAAWMAAGREAWREYQDPSRAVARRLRSPDPVTRLEAAADLSRFSGVPSGFTLVELTRALDDADPRVRSWAAASLGPMIGEAMRSGAFVPEARAAASRLVTAMRDRAPEVRIAVAVALTGALAGVDPDRVVAELTRALSDPEPSVRSAVISTMMGVGRAVPVAASPQLVSALDSESVEVRTNAATIIAAFQSGTDGALPALFRAVERRTGTNRAADGPDVQAAWGALQRIRPSGNAVPYLIARLADPRPEVRSTAATLLGRVGGEADAATPALIAMLDEPLTAVESAVVPPSAVIARPVDAPATSAAMALGAIGARTARSRGKIVTALTGAIRSGSPPRCVAAAQALVAIHNEHRHSPEVMALLKPTVPVMITALRESLTAPHGRGDEAALIQAIGLLAQGSDRAPEAVEVLTEAIRSGRPNIVAPALLALAGFGSAAAPALETVRSLQDDPTYRSIAEHTLRSIDPDP